MRALSDAGVRVGLGVDGSASNERSDLLFEVKQALLVARGIGGPAALTVREALRLGALGSERRHARLSLLRELFGLDEPAAEERPAAEVRELRRP